MREAARLTNPRRSILYVCSFGPSTFVCSTWQCQLWNAMKNSTSKVREMHDTRDKSHSGDEWMMQQVLQPATSCSQTATGPATIVSRRPDGHRPCTPVLSTARHPPSVVGPALSSKASMLLSHPASGEDVRGDMVVALGIYTEHWMLVKQRLAGIYNCCINVASAFRLEAEEDTRGSGFDPQTRSRMKKKRTWPVVWEVAMSVLNKFGFLIVLCNHGRHRSLSLAYELSAFRARCWLVSMRDPDRPSETLHPNDVLDFITPRLVRHIGAFGSHPRPVVGIHVCRYGFDGTAWASNENFDAPPTKYRHLDLTPENILIEIRPNEASMEWVFGILVCNGAESPIGWYPPRYVDPLDHLYANLMVFQCDPHHDPPSDPAPQAHRGERARDRTCWICYGAYFGSGLCSNSPRCPRSSRHRWNQSTIMAARREWTRAAISADVARLLGVMRAEMALATEEFRLDARVRSHER